MLTLLLMLLGCGHPFIADELTPEGCIIPDVAIRDPALWRDDGGHGDYIACMIYEEATCYCFSTYDANAVFRLPTAEEEAWCSREIYWNAPECSSR